MTELKAYDEALQSGQYQKPGGLLGKYDNVRRFWEDQQLGLYLRPCLEQLVADKRHRRQKLRIIDIGCGNGDGFDFITHIYHSARSLSAADSKIITPEMLDAYVGVDINEGLLEQARAGFANQPYMRFIQGDVNEYDFAREEAFDLYLANYGTLSHNEDSQTVDLLARIASQSRVGATILIDWLGRYSYEWQTLWTENPAENRWMDYIISYIHAGRGTDTADLTSFPLRIMSKAEAERVCDEAAEKAGGQLVLRTLADRSTFVGRHIDTAQYNPHAQPLRRMVNSLFEPDLCTDLGQLRLQYVPRQGFHEVNSYHAEFARWWNHLVDCTGAMMAGDSLPDTASQVPPVVKTMLHIMENVVSAGRETPVGNPRASLVEPQLAYCLRELESGLQKGLGCGHGLVAILQVTD